MDNMKDCVGLDRRRLGRFRLLWDWEWKFTRQQMSRAFGVCYPVRAEARYDLKCIEYTCVSRLFEPVEPGMEVPMYDMSWDGVRWTATRRAA